MRILACAILLGMVLSGLALSTPFGEGVEASLSPGIIQLELPELGNQRYGPGILRIPDPASIRRLVLHIPLTRIHRAFPKINTMGIGVVQTIRARKDEVLCEIDLSLHQGRSYALKAADNTVEIKVEPSLGVDPLYAQWVIAPPKEPQAWQSQQRLEGGVSAARAEMSPEGLVVLEELEDGSLNRLDKGITTAHRVFLQARFPRREESVSLRIHWTSEAGGDRTFSVGSWSGRSGSKEALLGGDVELSLGQNRIDVEVMHGYTALSRSTYRIYRRAPSSPTAITGNKWAVVIGISDYRADDLDLRYADRDAEAMRDFLIQKGGFASERVRFLSNQHATISEIRTSLFTFLGSPQPDDMVLIFLAGHGVQDATNPDNFFFLAHDSELANLGGSALAMWDLGQVMNYTIQAQRIVVIADTCHSGAALDRGGPTDTKGLNFFNKYLESLARSKGRLVLTASQAHENSLESTELTHGVFTHSLLLGLQGAADDNPTDGVVTAAELVDYLRTKVPDETAGEQHPSYSEESFDMNLPLAHVRREKPLKR